MTYYNKKLIFIKIGAWTTITMNITDYYVIWIINHVFNNAYQYIHKC